MKSIRSLVILIFSFIVFLVFKNIFAEEPIEKGFNCFSILVGKNASVDGSVLFAHNEDDGGVQLVNYYKVPRIKHEKDEIITFRNGAVISQAAETNEYLWFEMPGMEVSDSYINEWGVAIASDVCNSREQNGELKNGGITYWLRRLVIERAKSAKEGIKIAGELIQEYGYASSGRTYVIADPNEGWMLSAVFGKHWVAQRIPDDHVAVLPNYYTIGEIDLADTTNFFGSPDIIDYAVQQGWYNPESDGKFHFAQVYSQPEALTSTGNIHRMWRGINLITGENYTVDDEFPFSLKPKKKISLQDLKNVLRDHYEGTELDNTQGYKLGNPHQENSAAICANSTQYGFIAQLRNWLPLEIGAVVWLAQRRPDSQAFIPWYSGINKIPAGYAYGDFKSALEQHFNPLESIHEKTNKHAFWAFVTLAEWIDEDYGKRIKRVQQKWEGIEEKVINDQLGFEKKVLKIYEMSPLIARQLLTKYSSGWAKNSWQIAKELKGYARRIEDE